MNEINDDLEIAKFLTKPNKSAKELVQYYSNYFNMIYPFTTENLNAYYKHFDFNNKKYLTVTGSGDQTLNAILNGCKKIDCFDINPMAKYYQELKIEAVKQLNYLEFLIFFVKKITSFKNNKEVFNKKIYNKIILKGNNKKFWNSIFKSKKNIEKSHLFNKDINNLETLININEYLTEENFYKLKNILLNEKIEINYYDLNIKNLYKLENKYDLVNLSNIASYLETIYDKKLLVNFKKIIENIKLNENGIIIINYFYNRMDDRYDNDDIYSKKYREKCFKDLNYDYIFFDSISNNKHKYLKKIFNYKDCIMYIKK